jgi:hypothetical protein
MQKSHPPVHGIDAATRQSARIDPPRALGETGEADRPRLAFDSEIELAGEAGPPGLVGYRQFGFDLGRAEAMFGISLEVPGPSRPAAGLLHAISRSFTFAARSA